MPVDYARFEGLGDSSSSGSEAGDGGGDDFVGCARSESGLLRAFIAINERRLEVDKLAADRHSASGGSGWALRDVAKAYDDIATRLLTLDGVGEEAKLRSFGHRSEIAVARLGASKALLAVNDLEAAELRAEQALDALREFPDADVLRKEGASQENIEAGRRLMRDRLADAYVGRGEARLLRGNYAGAREDGLVAIAAAKEKGDNEQLEASQGLALRGEMALHGGCPGPDGMGTALSPEDVAELQVGSHVVQMVEAEEGATDSASGTPAAAGAPAASGDGSAAGAGFGPAGAWDMSAMD